MRDSSNNDFLWGTVKYTLFMGRIKSIGQMDVTYSLWNGRISKIGFMDVNYTLLGQIKNIGHYNVEYHFLGNRLKSIGGMTVCYSMFPYRMKWIGHQYKESKPSSSRLLMNGCKNTVSVLGGLFGLGGSLALNFYQYTITPFFKKVAVCFFGKR
jgi:hypothetical protein